MMKFLIAKLKGGDNKTIEACWTETPSAATAGRRCTMKPKIVNGGSLPRLVRLRGKALIAYRHDLLAKEQTAIGEMKHAAMRLEWEKKWHSKAKRDLLRAGRTYGRALQAHWLTIGKDEITLPNVCMSEGADKR